VMGVPRVVSIREQKVVSHATAKAKHALNSKLILFTETYNCQKQVRPQLDMGLVSINGLLCQNAHTGLMPARHAGKNMCGKHTQG